MAATLELDAGGEKRESEPDDSREEALMRNRWSWLLVLLLPLSPARPYGNLLATQSAETRSVHSDEAARVWRQWQQRARMFQSARRMLQQANVPFDPDVLLASNWREKVAPWLWRMPEMPAVRYETEPLAGVYLADTLDLPKHVELAGETVVLVRHVIFEGTRAVIKGNHRIRLFPN